MARSAIGWYVHYNAQNYIDYGVLPKKNGKKMSTSLTSYWSSIRDEIKIKVTTRNFSSTEIQYIENKLNAYRKMIILDTSQEMKKVRTKIIDLILKKFGSNIEGPNSFKFDMGDIQQLSPSSVDKNIQNLQENKTNVKKHFSGKNITYLNTVLKEFIKAYRSLNNISSVDDKKKILEELKKVDAWFTSLIAAEDQTIRANNDLTGIHTSKTLISRETADQAISLIRQAMGITEVEGLSKAKGAFEEYIETAAALAAKGYSADAIVKFLESVYQKTGGAHHTRGTIASHDLIQINQKAAAALKNNDLIYFDSKSGEYKYKTTYHSEQKLDVSFEYTFHGQPKAIGLNIKNYNLFSSRALSLVTNSPLSHFLFNISNVDTINHFLNILATHPTYPATFKKASIIAQEALGYYLLWAALTGQGVGKTEGFADVFVVNNNKDKYGVRVFDINQLIQNVMEKSPKSLIIEPTPLRLKNTFVKGVNPGASIQFRLTNLIADAHAKKISVSLPPQALNL